MEIHKRLRELRLARGEKQTEVAEAIGVTDRQYQRFEAGTNLPGLQNFWALADHFGISMDALAGREFDK